MLRTLFRSASIGTLALALYLAGFATSLSAQSPAQGQTCEQEKSYRIAFFQCYDGTESRQGGETSCKPSSLWQRYAEEYCRDRCGKDGKCGVNTFWVEQECTSSTVCSEGGSSSSASAASSQPVPSQEPGKGCPSLEEQIKQCGGRGFTTFHDGTCKWVKCAPKLLGKPVEKPGDTGGTISCKKQISGSCTIIHCEDGFRYNSCEQTMCTMPERKIITIPLPSPLSTEKTVAPTEIPATQAPPSPCLEIEREAKAVYLKLKENPSDAPLKKTLEDLKVKVQSCRKVNAKKMRPAKGNALFIVCAQYEKLIGEFEAKRTSDPENPGIRKAILNLKLKHEKCMQSG